jgi:hypothetical protein
VRHIPFLVDAAVDREWPHHSARQWLIYVAGLVAIFVVGGLLELRMERRQRSRDADESPRATA